jgi:hypothetical protein
MMKSKNTRAAEEYVDIALEVGGKCGEQGSDVALLLHRNGHCRRDATKELGINSRSLSRGSGKASIAACRTYK